MNEIRLGNPFIELTQVDSTNNYAMALATDGTAYAGTAIFAHAQTAGKGQRGKSWVTEPGQNLILSVIVPPHLSFEQAFQLSAAMALAAIHWMEDLTGATDCKIKWPNDLYWRDRKAGGILIENCFRGEEWRYAIVGIGVNINQVQFPPHLPNPVSLYQICGKTFDTVAVAKLLCNYFQNAWYLLHNQPTALWQQYQQHLYGLGQEVLFQDEDRQFLGTVLGVADNGWLKVAENGITRSYPLGALHWLKVHPSP